MSTQLSLFDRLPRRLIPRGEPIYLAALPGQQLGAPLTRLAERLRHDFGVRARFNDRDRLHVSILGIGIAEELTEDEVGAAIDASRGFVVEPFEMTFVRVMSYRRRPSERAPVVLVPEDGGPVTELARTFADAMIGEGVDPRGRLDGGPHMTLLYDNAFVPLTDLSEPITVQIDNVALVRAHWGTGRRTILAKTAKRPIVQGPALPLLST